jgi:peptidoglycan/xylan/chitin deacetylase (PgdA/CDA1 family)
MKEVSNQDRLSVLAELPARLGVSLPSDPPVGCEPLSWPEVREMAANGVEVGGHTCTHPILSRVETREQLHDEISLCGKRIEAELQRPAQHFCYPNGRPADLNADTFAATRAAGYDSAVTTVSGLNTSRSDRFALRRIGVNPDVPPAWFHQVTAGFRVTERDA